MFKLVKQLIPSWKCKEVAIIAVLGVLLIIRTQMSIWLADVNGRVVKAIVEKNLRNFIYRVIITVVLLIRDFLCVDICTFPFCTALQHDQLPNRLLPKEASAGV